MASTCDKAGVRTYTCGCGETKTESIPTTGHKYGAWATTTKATVFAPAVQTRTCIKVNASTLPLKVKQKISVFKVTGLANGDSVQSYKSSNTKIFTVTQSGVIKAGKKTGKANLTPSLTPITSTQKFTYKTSNKKVAAVRKKGVITAKKAGKTKITVKSGKKKYTVTVTVTK